MIRTILSFFDPLFQISKSEIICLTKYMITSNFPSFVKLEFSTNLPLNSLIATYICTTLLFRLSIWYTGDQINKHVILSAWILILWRQMMIMYNLIILWKSLAKYIISKFPHSDGICFVCKKRRRISNVRSEKKWGRNVFNKSKMLHFKYITIISIQILQMLTISP